MVKVVKVWIEDKDNDSRKKLSNMLQDMVNNYNMVNSLIPIEITDNMTLAFSILEIIRNIKMTGTDEDLDNIIDLIYYIYDNNLIGFEEKGD